MQILGFRPVQRVLSFWVLIVSGNSLNVGSLEGVGLGMSRLQGISTFSGLGCLGRECTGIGGCLESWNVGFSLGIYVLWCVSGMNL